MWNNRNRSEIPVTFLFAALRLNKAQVGGGGGLGCIKICWAPWRLGRIKNHLGWFLEKSLKRFVKWWFSVGFLVQLEWNAVNERYYSSPNIEHPQTEPPLALHEGFWGFPIEPRFAKPGKALQTLDSVPPMSFLTNLFYRFLFHQFPMNKKSPYRPHLLPEPISNVEPDIGDDANKKHLGIKWWNTF